ncbi:MAG: dephospho-CoA kinase [Alistipes indistinctus]
MHKWTPRKNTVILSADNIAVNPSAVVPGSYDISTFALQNIISAKISDLKIKSVEAPSKWNSPNVPDEKDRHNRRNRQRQKHRVPRIPAMLGAAVYDSDREARRLMNRDPQLIMRISSLFGPEAYRDGELNRSYVAGAAVFNDPALLAQLNGIVHPAVAADFQQWACNNTRLMSSKRVRSSLKPGPTARWTPRSPW